MGAREHGIEHFPKAVVRDISSTWFWAATAAVAATGISVLQDALFGGLDTGIPLTVAAAQYALPWLTWAALAPALLYLFEQYPLDLRAPRRAIAIYLFASLLVVALKLVISAPAAALLIWRPMHISFSDGVSWLLAHRSGSNLLMFWLLVSAYTAFRYYKLSSVTAGVPTTEEPLRRIPVRKGERTGFVDVARVTFAQAERNQLVVHTTDGRYTTRITLHDLARRLPAATFLRIHRSRLVNLDHIDAIEPWGRGDYVIIMNDGTRVISGKTYREAIRGILTVGER